MYITWRSQVSFKTSQEIHKWDKIFAWRHFIKVQGLTNLVLSCNVIDTSAVPQLRLPCCYTRRWGLIQYVICGTASRRFFRTRFWNRWYHAEKAHRLPSNVNVVSKLVDSASSTNNPVPRSRPIRFEVASEPLPHTACIQFKKNTPITESRRAGEKLNWYRILTIVHRTERVANMSSLGLISGASRLLIKLVMVINPSCKGGSLRCSESRWSCPEPVDSLHQTCARDDPRGLAILSQPHNTLTWTRTLNSLHNPLTQAQAQTQNSPLLQNSILHHPHTIGTSQAPDCDLLILDYLKLTTLSIIDLDLALM
jgi:hypothetical protein